MCRNGDPRHGEWVAHSGYADVEHKQALDRDAIFSLASVGKMYNAVAVMKLVEDGKLKLDDLISAYLPSEIITSLPHANQVTIRQLLRHESGFYNYETDPELNRLYLSGQLDLDTLSHLNALRRYVYGKPSSCLPGTEHQYSSTNYVLLALIVDSLVNEGHSVYLRNLLRDYGFTHTYYRQTPPDHGVHYYGDLNQDDKTEDITRQVIETTNWFIGDDGIYASIADAAHFIQALMGGKILNERSLKEMKTWDRKKDPEYGLGLMVDKSYPYRLSIGHGGRGIGATVDLYYFPKQDRTVALFCNSGLRGSPQAVRASYRKMRAQVIKKLFGL